tara:strand:- start:3814 stop:4179 length:366 start_codon:yes stop_codon:yes gene_type:complete
MGAEGAPSVIRRGIRANMEVIPVPLHYTPFMCIFHVTQEGSMQTTAEKQRTNITLTAENLAAARELGLNVSAISDAAVGDAVRAARAAAWASDNAAAISERRAWIETNGMPLADVQVLRLG